MSIYPCVSLLVSVLLSPTIHLVIGCYCWLHTLVLLNKPGPSNCHNLCLWTPSVCGCYKPHWNSTQRCFPSSIVSGLLVVCVDEWFLYVCSIAFLWEMLPGGCSKSPLTCIATMSCLLVQQGHKKPILHHFILDSLESDVGDTWT